MLSRMGVKRPLEEENLTGLSFEQPKHNASKKKLTLVTEDIPSQPTAPTVMSPGEAKSKLCELDSFVMPERGEGEFIVGKALDASTPFSLVTSSRTEEHIGNQSTSLGFSVPDFIDFTISRVPLEQFEDPYAFMSNCYPRKDIPIGPDHQVEVPDWDPNVSEERFSGSNSLIEDERELKLMGACISPLPDLNDLNSDFYAVGHGRTHCCCPDTVSARCVQQHVTEAREKLCNAIGEETFTKLGFSEMGEVVAARFWSPDDEQLFHKVVVSNPASLGADFWKHLAVVFPTRTKEELVGYYFNVFMLRRRRVQNRSFLLQIDSDDDEDCTFARVHYPCSRYMLEEDGNEVQNVHVGGDEGSDESFSEQELDACWEDGFGPQPEYVCCNNRDGILTKDNVDEGSHHNRDGNVPKQDR